MIPALNTPSVPISLEKFAYETIKESILTFRLPPGQTVVESDLAHRLGISKTPVRDALLRLEKEGFVTKFPYKGYAVTEITRESIADMFEIRSVLEGLAARLATPQFTGDDFSAAQAIVDQHRQALKMNDVAPANRLNRQFHDLIIMRAANQRLEAMLNNLDDHMRRYRVLSNYQSGRLEKSVDEHQLVLDAIRSGSPDAAESAIRAHILSVMDDMEQQDFQELISLASAAPAADLT